jgi:hypothetical protein
MWPFNNKPKRIQPALITTEDGRIVEIQLEVEKGYMVHHASKQAWGLSPNLLVRKKGTSIMYAILDERDAAPLVIEGKKISRKNLNENIHLIATEARKQTQYEVQQKQNKDRMAKAMTLAITCCAICVVLVVVVSMFTGGGTM